MCDHLAEGASILSQLECAGKLDLLENTPQPLYNTIVGVHSINRVS